MHQSTKHSSRGSSSCHAQFPRAVEPHYSGWHWAHSVGIPGASETWKLLGPTLFQWKHNLHFHKIFRWLVCELQFVHSAMEEFCFKCGSSMVFRVTSISEIHLPWSLLWHVAEEGRNHLRKNNEPWRVIQADPLRFQWPVPGQNYGILSVSIKLKYLLSEDRWDSSCF